ncbi:MAG TPA: hypothetical protein VFZ53_15740 [Polyangiaceae bacterium]
MAADPDERKPLGDSLERLEEALAHSRSSAARAVQASPAALGRVRPTTTIARPVAIPLMAVLLVVLLWLGATAGSIFFLPAVLPGLALVALLVGRRAVPPSGLLPGGGGPRVRMGASVASDVVLGQGCVIDMGATVEAGAVLREGSVVEMGATVEAGAVLERGATVRMGATVGPRAVLEEGASVSWGASVGAGAVIGAGAVVAAGSDVAAGARVPAHMYLAAGTSWSSGQGENRELAAAESRNEFEGVSDPRVEQIKKACARLDDEYTRAPEPVRAMFGDARSTVSSLRRTCLDLVAREQALRAEATPETLARLDEEKTAIEARLALANDDHVRKSLSGAVTAIAAQRDQRRMLANKADRLEAELTRLIWTLDAMGTELVRVRTAGTELYEGSTADIARSVEQLRDEIDGIAQALEEVNR